MKFVFEEEWATLLLRLAKYGVNRCTFYTIFAHYIHRFSQASALLGNIIVD